MHVTIVNYQEDWPLQFLQEKKTIEDILTLLHPTVEHIGSTAIPGMSAKPVIDILVGVKQSSHLDLVVPPLLNNKYNYVKKYESLWPNRRLFVKAKPINRKYLPAIIDVHHGFQSGVDYQTTANIHVVILDSFHWLRHIAFRDYLKAYWHERNRYLCLKTSLARLEFKEMQDYNLAKDALIKELESKAIKWYLQQL